VFNDEIGEPVLQLSRREIVRRFGPPVATRDEGGLECAYYEVVGFAEDDWQFCFADDGRMKSAAGSRPPP
jgi:hypothetical protein